MEVEAFLTWLADDQRVAAATHRQALAAILFLYTRVLQVELPWLTSIGRPRERHRLPVVLSRDEVGRVLAALTGEHALLARYPFPPNHNCRDQATNLPSASCSAVPACSFRPSRSSGQPVTI